MSITYTTITAKGRITLPVEARRALGLQAGQRVGVRVDGDHLIIDVSSDIAAVRERIRAESDSLGTTATIPQAGDGWTARAEELHAKP